MEIIKYTGKSNFICILAKEYDVYFAIFGKTAKPELNLDKEVEEVYGKFNSKLFAFEKNNTAAFSTNFIDFNGKLFTMLSLHDEAEYETVIRVLGCIYE